MSNNSNIALQKNKKVVEFCTIFLPAHQKKKDTTEEEKKNNEKTPIIEVQGRVNQYS